VVSALSARWHPATMAETSSTPTYLRIYTARLR
jgi:hypothetical protein